MSICHREVVFDHQPPSFQEIARRVSERTGIVAIYNQDDWSFTNSEDEEDNFGIYYEEPNQITLTNQGPQTYLLGATLHTLVEMGGKYNSTIAGWTAKKWEAVADKIKALPKQDHPDWLFD